MMMVLALIALALVTVAMNPDAPAKRKPETYDPDADVYSWFHEKPKRGAIYVLTDDGEILEVADGDWHPM